MLRRGLLSGAITALIALVTTAGAASAATPPAVLQALRAAGFPTSATASSPAPEPGDALGYDCLGYRWAQDPKPGTPQWTDRDRENQYCSTERYFDRGWQPLGNTAAMYGQDPYRIPTLPGNAGTRFRFDHPTIPGIPAVEVYRPCPTTGPQRCRNMPRGLRTFDPPYPVVVIFHGFTASMQLHRWTAQPLAEAGYMTITVNGTCPCPYLVSTPNSQTTSNGTNILNWLEAHRGLAADADLNRIGFAGHSQGGAVILGFQGDRRVSAMVDYDGGTTASASNTFQPIMYQGEDAGFQFQPPTPSESQASTTPEAASGYDTLRAAHVDTMGLSFRAWTHTDYNGNGGPAGNRWAELTSNYFTLAWFDRYLKGKLAVDRQGRVITSGGRTAAQERAYRQALARDAYDRLLVTPSKLFDNSVDIHNISMGFWDPAKAEASGDPLMGGNVPYKLQGAPIKNRLSFYAPSVCYVSAPDYTGGGDVSYGGANDAVISRADSSVHGDMRLHGCPQVFSKLARPATTRRCLSGARGIGALRVGRTRSQLLRRAGVEPVRRTRYSYRWCVRGSARTVSAVFTGPSRTARAVLVVTGAAAYRAAGVGPGMRVASLLRRFPTARSIGAGVYRAGSRIFGVRRGTIRFAGVAAGSLLRSPRRLAASLRRAGL